jgi:hypothetical protein
MQLDFSKLRRLQVIFKTINTLFSYILDNRAKAIRDKVEFKRVIAKSQAKSMRESEIGNLDVF